MQVDAVGSPAAPVPTACTRPPLALPAPRRIAQQWLCRLVRASHITPTQTHAPAMRPPSRSNGDTLTHAKASLAPTLLAGNALRSHEGKRATRGNACDEAILIR